MKTNCPCYLFLSAIAAIALLSILSEYQVVSFNLTSAAYLIGFVCGAGVLLLFLADYRVGSASKLRSSPPRRARSEKASLPPVHATPGTHALHPLGLHSSLTTH